jgi:signal peptidase I
VIAAPGDWVDIDEEGTVTVNDNILVEPYISEKAFGETNVEFPMQIPENRWFVLGDHRSVSIDSRNTAVGCVSDEQVVGKLVVCIWPFKKIGFISG